MFADFIDVFKISVFEHLLETLNLEHGIYSTEKPLDY